MSRHDVRAWALRVYLLVVALTLLIGVGLARAQSACNGSWTITSGAADAIGYSTSLGVSSAACAAERARVTALGSVQSSCSVSGGVMTEAGTTGGGVSFFYVWTEQPSGCVESPSAPASASGLDWSNTSHVMQALIVAICAIAMVMGYRAGDKL